MRRRAGLIGFIVVAAILVVGSAVLVRVGQAGTLSVPRLATELHERGAAALVLIGIWGLPGTCVLMGIFVGWLGGSWHAQSRLRRRSLLLIDTNAPDMPFKEGIYYIRSLTGEGSRQPTDVAAAHLLFAAACAGKLSLWDTTAVVSRRVPPRQLRRIASMRRDMPSTAADLTALMLLSLVRREVEKLWPQHVILELHAHRGDRKS